MEAHAAQSGKIINVLDHGAIGDGHKDDTNAINNCIGMLQTGDTIVFPPRKDGKHAHYLCGPLTFSGTKTDGSQIDHFTIDIKEGATLLAHSKCWGTDGTTTFITVEKCNNVTIQGQGVIDGHGGHWWATWQSGSHPRTFGAGFMVEVTHCKKVHMKQLRLHNPPHITLKIDNCGHGDDAAAPTETEEEKVIIEHLTIRADWNKPKYNLAGIAVNASKNVLVQHVNLLQMTDDNLVVKADCHNVTFKHITIDGQGDAPDPVPLIADGASIGTEVGHGSAILFKHIKVSNLRNAFHLKPALGQHVHLDGATWNDCSVDNVLAAICVEGRLQTDGDAEPPYYITMKNVVFKHITGTVADGGYAYMVTFNAPTTSLAPTSFDPTKVSIKGEITLNRIEVTTPEHWGNDDDYGKFTQPANYKSYVMDLKIEK